MPSRKAFSETANFYSLSSTFVSVKLISSLKDFSENMMVLLYTICQYIKVVYASRV